jgi:hypothetical protein
MGLPVYLYWFISYIFYNPNTLIINFFLNLELFLINKSILTVNITKKRIS